MLKQIRAAFIDKSVGIRMFHRLARFTSHKPEKTGGEEKYIYDEAQRLMYCLIRP
jgi:hypothetical protein